MGNIMDYLDWRGDITFEQSPFNEVDNVILAQLAYVNFRILYHHLRRREVLH